ncbi:MAG: Asp-tRNA(Asn)/Glu-tRNA(Gln) amidotransferase subunit GatA [Treponema sp.]|nr:Asp-tRNA(Asn)/Glu-tRNA(Gln) amidotransferase subunit GatA [Treponema sp.]
MSALELSAAIRAKKLGVAETANAYIGLIEKTNRHFNAFLAVSGEKALAQAENVQAQIDRGETLSPLAGVPIAIKDNISTVGIETTCASRMLGGYIPVFNATVVDRLEKAGMIVVGKLNMDEFAMGSSNETGAFGPVRNPWDTSRVPGGSSGGSAVAVAAGMVPLSLGSDTGGSIRQPCAFCGVTGIKPTYGSVSRHGLVACASSLDQIGPLGKDIDDCAALLSAISGPDAMDGTCTMAEPFAFDHGRPETLEGIRIGLPGNYFDNDINRDVKQAILAAAKEFGAAGASVEEFEMPLTDYMVPTYYAITCAEVSSNLSRYDGLKYGYRSADTNNRTLSDVYRFSRSEGFGPEVKKRIMLGSLVLSSGCYDAYYRKALQVRSLVKNAYDNLFRRFDIILSPVASTTAYRLGENFGESMTAYNEGLYTVSVNLAGLPAVALPCGFDPQGLPIGFQLVGNAFSEGRLVAAARVYQGRTNHHAVKPGTKDPAQP